LLFSLFYAANFQQMDNFIEYQFKITRDHMVSI